RRGLVARVVPALIGYDHPKPCAGQRTNLMAPTVPELREPVQQDHQRPALWPRLNDVEPNPVRRDVLVPKFSVATVHSGTSNRREWPNVIGLSFESSRGDRHANRRVHLGTPFLTHHQPERIKPTG